MSFSFKHFQIREKHLSKKLSTFTFVDQEKAFDSVPQTILWGRVCGVEWSGVCKHGVCKRGVEKLVIKVI